MASPRVFHLIFHTHWDREWYLPEAAFRPRLVRAVEHLVDSLEGDRDARFVLDGQTVLADDATAMRPTLRARLTDAVRREQLEIGPWYILADEQLPAGESLVRNLQHGAAGAERFGGRMNVLYSPDAFGHPGILPTLAAEFGIERAVVWRGVGDGTSDLWRWVGPDGRSVVTYSLPPHGYEVGALLAGMNHDLAAAWPTIRDPLVARARTAHIAVFVGADHHAPPDDQSAILARLQALESGNFVRISSLGEFFDAVDAERTDLRVVVGELRRTHPGTWILQGVHGTRARLKRRFGQVERALFRRAEPLAAIAQWHADADLRATVTAAEAELLRCQFHDTLAGTVSDGVAREQAVRLASAGAIADDVARVALERLIGHDADRARDEPARARPCLVAWNPAARRRDGIAIATITSLRRRVPVGPPGHRRYPAGEGFAASVLRAPDGGEVPIQILHRSRALERTDAERHYPALAEIDRVQIAFRVSALPGLGAHRYLVVPGRATPPDEELSASPGRLANAHVEMHAGGDGRIILIDRRTGERYVDLFELVDESDLGDCYTPELAARRVRIDMQPPELLAAGPLIAAIATRFVCITPTGEIAGRRIVALHAGSAIVRVRLEFANRATDHRLRLRVPAGAGDAALAGAAFGFERRYPVAAPARWQGERPTPTAPAHRYVAAAGGIRGIALLAPGFFEYEWTRRHDFFFTVLRAIGELSRADLPGRPGHAAWPVDTPEAQEPGLHMVEFAVTPVTEAEASNPDLLESFWEDAFAPPQATFIREFCGESGLTGAFSGVELTGEALVFSAAKPAESGDGIVLRCFNVADAPVEGRWTLPAPPRSAWNARADESIVAPLAVAGRDVVFTAPPRGIVTTIVAPPADRNRGGEDATDR